jgi:hypothetical protein
MPLLDGPQALLVVLRTMSGHRILSTATAVGNAVRMQIMILQHIKQTITMSNKAMDTKYNQTIIRSCRNLMTPVTY